MTSEETTAAFIVHLVSYPPYPVRSARRAGPSGRRSDGRGTEGDDKRSESETRSDRQAKPKGTEMANGKTTDDPTLVSWVPLLVSSFPCVPRSVVSGSLRSPFHSLRVPRGKGDE